MATYLFKHVLTRLIPKDISSDSAVALMKAAMEKMPEANLFTAKDVQTVQFEAKLNDGGGFAKFCEILEQTGDPCGLVSLAETARTMEQNRVYIAITIEDAIFEFCRKPSIDPSEFDVKKNVFSKLMDMFTRHELDNRVSEFTQYADSPVVAWYLTHCTSSLAIPAKRRKESPSRFEAPDVPRFSHYLKRPAIERQIFDQLKKTADKPRAGALAILGGGGMGKTTTMSHLLTDDEIFGQKLLNEFRLNVAIWLNCFQWCDSFDETAFKQKLVDLCQSAVQPNKIPASELSDLEKVVKFLEQAVMGRPIFIFDDMFNVNLLKFFRKNCPNTVCCIITRDVNELHRYDTSSPSFRLVQSTICISEFADREVEAALKETYDLAGKLTDDQIQELAKRCYKLPLIVGLVGPYFSYCTSPDDYTDEYNILMKELECIVEKELSDSQYKTVEKLFQFSIERLENDKVRRLYYAFLLFDPAEAVKVSDLAILWGYDPETTEVFGKTVRLEGPCTAAIEMSRRYQKSSLVTRLEVELPNQSCRGGSSKVPALLVHQMLYEAAARYAMSKLNFCSLHELRFRIVSGLCFHFNEESWCQRNDHDGDLGKLLCQVVESENRALSERIVRNLDAQTLLKICKAPMPGEDSVTFLKFLFDWYWLGNYLVVGDNHSYKLITNIVLKLRANGIGESEIGAALMQESSSGSSFFNRFLTTLDTEKNLIADNEMNNTRNNDFQNLMEALSPWLKGDDAKTSPIIIIIALRTGNVDIGTLTALYKKHPEAVGTPCMKHGRTPLSYAAENGQLENVKFLFGKCPEAAEILDKGSRTPLSWAAEKGHYETVKFLFEKFEKPAEIPDQEYGQTPLSYAAKTGHLKVVTFLFEKYPKAAEIPDNDGRTPLSYAAEKGNLEIVKFLGEKCPEGAKMSDKDGKTPFLLAAEQGKFEILKFLFNVCPKAAEIPDQEYGQTPLSYAAENGYLEIVKFLFEKYPKAAEIPDNDGRTPLSLAAKRGHLVIVKFLFEKCPEVAKMPDKDGKTPLLVATEWRHLEIANFLSEKCNETLKMPNHNGQTPSGDI